MSCAKNKKKKKRERKQKQRGSFSVGVIFYSNTKINQIEQPKQYHTASYIKD